ncbi:MAG: YkvA family protein, partial [Chloroflexota bacterium]|nr:YkvA family protein [Chloroflexota bacterium]
MVAPDPRVGRLANRVGARVTVSSKTSLVPPTLSAMDLWLTLALGFSAVIACLLLAGFVWMWRTARRPGDAVEELRALATEVVRLPGRLRAVAADPRTPRRARWWLVGLAIYVVSPIDPIPDFLPVIGHLDELVVVPLVLRHVRGMVPAEVWESYFPPGRRSSQIGISSGEWPQIGTDCLSPAPGEVLDTPFGVRSGPRDPMMAGRGGGVVRAGEDTDAGWAGAGRLARVVAAVALGLAAVALAVPAAREFADRHPGATLAAGLAMVVATLAWWGGARSGA